MLFAAYASHVFTNIGTIFSRHNFEGQVLLDHRIGFPSRVRTISGRVTITFSPSYGSLKEVSLWCLTETGRRNQMDTICVDKSVQGMRITEQGGTSVSIDRKFR